MMAMACDAGFRAWGLGLRFMVSSLGFRAWGFGFMVAGLRFRVCRFIEGSSPTAESQPNFPYGRSRGDGWGDVGFRA